MNQTAAARFDFFSGQGAVSEKGTFIVRPNEMVLEVQGDDGVYLLKGKPKEASGHSYYVGKHHGQPGDVSVSATWTKLDEGRWIGEWIEDGYEWVFIMTEQ